MPRRSPRLELSLLLAVAPLVAGCGGPEGRRCVGPDGVYLEETCSTLPSFAAFFAVAAAVLAVSVAVYVQVTPYAELALVREGNVAAAVSLGGTLVGLALPVASVVRNSHAVLDVAVWGAIGCAVQLLAYLAARAAIPQLAKDIPAGKIAPALFLAALSISVGLVNAACMEG